jgi:hypothetical protein
VKRASKETLAGRRYLDLQREAKRTGRPTDELIQLYALECFLGRLVHSEFADTLIREEDSYSGIRVTLGGTLSRAVVRFHVDVNVALRSAVSFADWMIERGGASSTWDPAEGKWIGVRG